MINHFLVVGFLTLNFKILKGNIGGNIVILHEISLAKKLIVLCQILYGFCLTTTKQTTIIE